MEEKMLKKIYDQNEELSNGIQDLSLLAMTIYLGGVVKKSREEGDKAVTFLGRLGLFLILVVQVMKLLVTAKKISGKGEK